MVVFDTNALLVPYTATQHGLAVLEKALKALKAQGRLVVPEQVATEFARNRPNKIGELHKALGVRLSAHVPELKSYPLLEGLPEYVEAKRLDSEIGKLGKALSRQLEALRGRLRQWSETDPVRSMFSTIISSEIVRSHGIDPKELEEIRRERYENRVPPGYKDQSKPDGGVGDLAIWLTILSIAGEANRDVIFVSADEKPDWFQQSDGPLFPKVELLAEFREITRGRILEIIRLSDLLERLDADSKGVAEIRKAETRAARDNPIAMMFARERRRVEVAVIAWVGNVFGREAAQQLMQQLLQGEEIVVLPDGRRIAVLIEFATSREKMHRTVGDARAIAKEFVDDVLVFFVSTDAELARQATTTFAEETYWGPRIAVRFGLLLSDGSLSFAPPVGLELGDLSRSSPIGR